MGHSHLSRDDLEALVETGRAIASDINLNSLLESILEKACELTDSPDGSLILYDPAEGSLYFGCARGAQADRVLATYGQDSPESIPLTGSIAGEVFTTGTPIVSDRLVGEQRHFDSADRRTGHKTDNMVCVPLEADVRLGVMQLLNKRDAPYSQRDVQLLEGFAAQSALAIRNARLITDLVAHMGLSSRDDRNDLADRLQQLAADPITEELTVLFADMRSFTQLAIRISGQELTAMLNEFLTVLCDETLRFDGLVNKIVGDGILALFRGDDHAVRAVQAAFAMTERFDIIHEEWEKVSSVPLDFIDIGLGIATGPVVLATFGSRQVKDFTAVGHPVNLANALEYNARNGARILADIATYSAVQHLVGEVEPDTVHIDREPAGAGTRHKSYHLQPLHRPQPGNMVFLAHNSSDKPAVKELANLLKKRGIEVWLDIERLVPGRPWVDGLGEAIKVAGSAVIVVGPDGMGPWEINEMRLCLDQMVGRHMPLIPVLLPGVETEPELPPFLETLTWVDLREGLSTEGIDRIEWGVTGTNPL